MHVWNSIGGAVCVAVTVVGLFLSWRIWRKSGATRGMRAVAWSLLPLAAYLTHTVKLLGRVVNAFVLFAGSFVFSSMTWAGVVVAALAGALFLVSGGLPLLNWRKSRERRKLAVAAKPDGTQPASGGAGRAGAGRAGNGRAGNGRAGKDVSKAPAARESADDDLSDIQEILRRRGIN